MTNRFGNPILFRTPFWVSLQSDPEAKLKFKPLSYKRIRETEYLNYSKAPNFLTVDELLIESLVDSYNFIGFPSNEAIITSLSTAEKNYLFSELSNMSIINQEQQKNLENIIAIALDPKMQDDNWDCDTCIHKKLQTHRACNFIPKEQHMPFKMRVRDTTFTNCPISLLDNFILAQAGEAYRLIEAGLLPEQGSIGDQTMWAVIASVTYKKLLNELEKEMLGSK